MRSMQSKRTTTSAWILLLSTMAGACPRTSSAAPEPATRGASSRPSPGGKQKDLPASTQTSKAQKERINTLIARINADPDPAHLDHTPAADELIEIGPAAISATLPLMLSDDVYERLRAQSVLGGVTAQMLVA